MRPNTIRYVIQYLLCIYLCAIPLLFLASSTRAQTPEIESCFSYYDYGKITANFNTEKIEYSAGDRATVYGSIVNNNTFPLVDVILYAHIRRINAQTHIDSGHYLIDKVTLLEDLSFNANESRDVSFKLPLKNTYPAGEYQIQYYILSKQAFHYGGRSFLEEDYAGVTNFSIKNSTVPLVYFDINSLQVNGQPHRVREQIVEFPAGQLSVQVGVIDGRTSKTDIPVKIKLYSFEDTTGNKLITQSETTYTVGQNTFEVSLNPPVPGAYVVLFEMNTPVQSMFKYRFAVAGTSPSELRMNDVGVSDFPATAQSRAWVCFHSPTPQNSAETTVTLSVLSSSQQVVDQVSLTDSFDGEVRAISLPLTKLATRDDFWIEAIFKENDRSRSVKIHYDCSQFDSSIKALELSYDISRPDSIAVSTTNSCGQKVQKPIIDMIRVRQGDTTIKDASNFDASSGYFEFGIQPAGTYTAEAKVGKTVKTTDFVIPANIEELQRKSRGAVPQPYLLLAGGLIIIMIGIFVFRLVRKK